MSAKLTVNMLDNVISIKFSYPCLRWKLNVKICPVLKYIVRDQANCQLCFICVICLSFSLLTH